MPDIVMGNFSNPNLKIDDILWVGLVSTIPVLQRLAKSTLRIENLWRRMLSKQSIYQNSIFWGTVVLKSLSI